MARRNPVVQLAQVAVSVALLSGCILEPTPEDSGERWAREEQPEEQTHLSITGKADLKLRMVSLDDMDEIPEPEKEPLPPSTSPPDTIEDVEEESRKEPIAVPIAERPVLKTDPQPEPQADPTANALPEEDPQPEPRASTERVRDNR